MVFRIKRCKVTVEYPFLLIIAFSLLLKNKSVFYVLLFSVLHETGHIAALLLFGFFPDSVTFSFYGIAMKHRAKLSALRETVFLLSGIAVNLVLAVLDVHREINIPLAAVNALPVIPLDGGRALSFFVDERCMKALSVITLISMLTVSVLTFNYSLFLISVYISVYSFFEGNYL